VWGDHTQQPQQPHGSHFRNFIEGTLQYLLVDKLAGATALILGSFGGVLMIIWKSRCKEFNCTTINNPDRSRKGSRKRSKRRGSCSRKRCKCKKRMLTNMV
jgi:hypothetical protein